jgi:hypothetical protein
MTTLCADPAKANLMAFPHNRGVSDEAHDLEKQVEALQWDFAQTITIGGLYEKTHRSIAEASKWAAVGNWDGYGAKPIDPDSCLRAIHFSKLLPMYVPIPEIDVDTDGEVRFEWYRGPRRLFSVAVRGNGELTYAGLFGVSKTHGTEYLSDELPKVILDNVSRVYS